MTMTTKTGSPYLYVTYIRTTPEQLWHALTDPAFIKQYWFGVTVTSEFRKGSPWKLELPDGKLGDSGEILESDPPRRLVIKWRNEWKPELTNEGYSRCEMELVPDGEAVKLTITHSIESGEGKFIAAVSGGWPKVLSNLKSLLETGKLALTEAY